MDPRPSVSALSSIERLAHFLDLLPEDGEIDTLRPAWPSARPIDIWRTDDRYLELITVLGNDFV